MRAASDIAKRSEDVRFEACLVHRGKEINGLASGSFEDEFRIFDAAIGKAGGCLAAVDEFAADKCAVLVHMVIEFDALSFERLADVCYAISRMRIATGASGSIALLARFRVAHHRSAHAIVGP